MSLGRKPIFGAAMTKAQRQRRWRARRDGKPLPHDRWFIKKLVTEALQLLIDEPDREFREQAAVLLQRQIFAAIDGDEWRPGYRPRPTS
jgi:hypothetical protein